MQDTLRQVNACNDHSEGQVGGALGTIECLALGIEWGLHHSPHAKPLTLHNAATRKAMESKNRHTTSERLDFMNEGLDLLRAKTRSLILHAKDVLDQRTERIVRLRSIHDKEAQLVRATWKSEPSSS